MLINIPPKFRASQSMVFLKWGQYDDIRPTCRLAALRWEKAVLSKGDDADIADRHKGRCKGISESCERESTIRLDEFQRIL